MSNSIKYILKIRGMQHKELCFDTMQRQYVSRYINRQRKIPEYVQEKWEKIMRVPSKYFVDEKRFCKELSLDDKQRLEDYLLSQQFSDTENDEWGWMMSRERQRAERMQYIQYELKRIKKQVEEDVYSVPDVADPMEEYVIDNIESNLQFYNRFLTLKSSNKISNEDWNGVFRAMSYFIMNQVEEDDIVEDEFVKEVYAAIKKRKQKISQQQLEGENFYKEIWGEPNPME